MTRNSWPYLIAALFVLGMAIVLAIVYVVLAPSAGSKEEIALNLGFGGTMASIVAVALALVSIAYSMKEAHIRIFLGDKHVTNSGTLQEIRVQNRGNALGNLASAMIEIDVPPSSLISFAGATGLNFQQTQSQSPRRYRFDDPMNPRPLYPAKYIWVNLGFVQAPPGSSGIVKFNVQVVGSQGRMRDKFEIDV